MKAIECIEDPGPHLSHDDIECYENVNGIIIDQAVKKLLGVVNGGGWHYNIVSYRDRGLHVEIKGLCCATTGELWDIASCLKSARDGRMHAPDWTPFAHTIGGDYFVSLDGNILWWKSDLDAFIAVDTDIFGFLDRLFVEPI